MSREKREEKNKAIALRKAGYSYSQIRKELNVSKGSLSLWLNDFPLSPKRIRELRDWNAARIENYVATRKRQRESILAEIKETEEKNIFPLSQRDLYIGGLFLYWGEGGKTKIYSPSLSNTDPAMLKFYIFWLVNIMGFDRSKIKIKLQLYSDMDIEKESDYWSNMLNIPRCQFKKSYIKKSLQSSLTYKTGFGHGTCNIDVGSSTLGKKILMSLKVLSEFSMRA